MSEIGIEYKKIMEEIENAISNEKEKQFVKQKWQNYLFLL